MNGTPAIGETIELLGQEWSKVCATLDSHESALVEASLGFLRRVATACLERGCRVWFRPNRWVHWGEGGFGRMHILVPPGDREPAADLPIEVHFITEVSQEQEPGEEITNLISPLDFWWNSWDQQSRWESVHQQCLRPNTDEEAFEALRGLKSLPFEPGRKVAVKVVDHHGNEMLEVLDLSKIEETKR